MADDICGHPTADGDPCQNPSGENGRCWIPAHNGEDDEYPSGRDTILDEDLAKQITRPIAEGKSVKSAARMAGVHPATVYTWLEKGDDADSTEWDDDVYGAFHDRFVRARGLGEDAYVDHIMDVAREEGDLVTLMSMLKQRYPDSWGDVDRGEQAGGVVVYADEPEEFEIDGESLEVTQDP